VSPRRHDPLCRRPPRILQSVVLHHRNIFWIQNIALVHRVHCDAFKHPLAVSPTPPSEAMKLATVLSAPSSRISLIIYHSLIIPADVRLFPSATKLA
jgi:hypothetical protein